MSEVVGLFDASEPRVAIPSLATLKSGKHINILKAREAAHNEVSQPLGSFTKHLLSTVTPYIGDNYRFGGLTRKGFDCSGFVMNIFKKYNYNLPHGSYNQVKHGQQIKKSQLKPGDLVFFDIRGKGRISHVGIYIGNGEFIHASTRKGVVIDPLSDKYYQRTYRTARRIVGVEAAL